jgi:hypothetical protein
MSVATELQRMIDSKAAIKAAIEGKGVTVDASVKLDGYAAKVEEITQGGGGDPGWQRPADWINISNAGTNEINLLVTEGTGIAFSVTVVGSGTYSIDWGDGDVEHNCTSASIRQHQHTANGTWCVSERYWMWKIRFYNATGNITRWKVERHTYTSRRQHPPILWAVFNIEGATSYANAFYNTTGQQVWCSQLKKCDVLHFVNCTSTGLMFFNCYGLSSLTLPESWGSITNTSSMFYNCFALTNITLPESWGSITNTSSLFQNCYGLKTITNLDYLGHQTINCDFTDFMRDCEFYQSAITINSRLSKIGIYGASGYVLKVTSIRLPNQNSTYTGSTPHVNVSYTSLNKAALVALFGDLPTLTGKTINITGAVGAADLTADDRAIATGKGWSITG